LFSFSGISPALVIFVLNAIISPYFTSAEQQPSDTKQLCSEAEYKPLPLPNGGSRSQVHQGQIRALKEPEKPLKIAHLREERLTPWLPRLICTCRADAKNDMEKKEANRTAWIEELQRATRSGTNEMKGILS
jgi:hypothetical protein